MQPSQRCRHFEHATISEVPPFWTCNHLKGAAILNMQPSQRCRHLEHTTISEIQPFYKHATISEIPPFYKHATNTDIMPFWTRNNLRDAAILNTCPSQRCRHFEITSFFSHADKLCIFYKQAFTVWQDEFDIEPAVILNMLPFWTLSLQTCHHFLHVILMKWQKYFAKQIFRHNFITFLKSRTSDCHFSTYCLFEDYHSAFLDKPPCLNHGALQLVPIKYYYKEV